VIETNFNFIYNSVIFSIFIN